MWSWLTVLVVRQCHGRSFFSMVCHVLSHCFCSFFSISLSIVHCGFIFLGILFPKIAHSLSVALFRLMLMKGKASRTPVARRNPLPHPNWMFTLPDGKPNFEKISSLIPVVHALSTNALPAFYPSHSAPSVWRSRSSFMKHLWIRCPHFLCKSFLRSDLRGRGNCPLIFCVRCSNWFLSTLCNILNRPNEGESTFLSSNNKFDLLSCMES